MPADLTNVASSWASCEPLFYGAYDPPSFLKKASRLALVQAGDGPVTSAGPAAATRVPAMAEAAPTHDHPRPTAVSNPSHSDLQNAAAVIPVKLGIVPSISAMSPIINEGKDSQAAPTDPASAPLSSPQDVPVGSPAAENHRVTRIIPGQPTPQTSPGSHQSVPDPLAGNPIPESEQNTPGETEGSTPVSTNQKTPQTDPQPLIVGSDGDVLVDIGSQKSPATAAALAQKPKEASPPTVSVDSNVNVYVLPTPSANDNIPISVSVAEASKMYAAPPSAEAHLVVTTAPPLSIGGQAAQVAPNGALHVAGQIIAQGEQATVNGAVVSVGTLSVVVDGTTQAMPITAIAAPLQNELPPLIGGKAIRTASAGALVVGEQTIAQGESATIDGSIISVGSNDVAVEGKIYAHPWATSPTTLAVPAPLVVAGHAISTAPRGGLVVAGKTIAQGSQATVAGTLISVGSSNIVLGSSTCAFPGVSSAIQTPAPMFIGGQALQAAVNGGFMVGDLTITQGGQITISGTLLSVGSSKIVIGTSTFGLPTGTTSVLTRTPLLIGGNTVQIASNGGILVGTDTVAEGTQTIISGVVISIGSSALVINGTTHSFNPTGIAIPTGDSNDEIILTQGEVVTKGGSVIAYSGAAVSTFVEKSNIVVGTATIPLEALVTGAAASQGALGGLIMSALGTGLASARTNGTSGLGSGTQTNDSAVKPSVTVGAGSGRMSMAWKSKEALALAIFALIGVIGSVVI